MNVYVLDVTPLAGRESEALAVLSPERRAKAGRICRTDARLRSIGAGLLLRMAGLTDGIRFGEFGKPFIPDKPEFSLTHSGSFAALAVNDAPVGLDIETIAPVRRASERALTPEEREYMAADPERRFAYLWTRKEAVLKCTGAGLSKPMNAFSALDESAELEGEHYSLFSAPLKNAVLSAAVRGDDAAFAPRFVSLHELFAVRTEERA